MIMDNNSNMIKKLYLCSALTVAGIQLLNAATPLADYSDGVFVVNEDWYGHCNSTINFLKGDGEWIYRVVQQENPGFELGCTNQYGAIYGGKFYLIAKQDKDPGASTYGARITVCSANDMSILKQIRIISTDKNATSGPDGRGFLGVDEHKGYVGSSNGIFVLDLDNLEIVGYISGTENGAETGYDELYGGQIGNMVRVDDYVYAVHQSKGLLVIDAATDKVVDVVEAPDGKGFGSVVLSKDGNLWLSIATNSSGGADKSIMRLNPVTRESSVIALPEGIYGPANSWYAWTPDGFCASTKHNVLYWNGGASSWFSGSQVFKYDIDNNVYSKIIDLDADGENWKIYGCSMRVHPIDDELYASLFHEFGNKAYIFRRYDSCGSKIEDFSMIENYWFPSLPVFPDVAAPEMRTFEQSISSTEPTEIALRGLATDDDNIDAAIVYSLGDVDVSGSSRVDVRVADGKLVITPVDVKEGETCTIEIKANSNGKVVSGESKVVFGNSGAVDASKVDSTFSIATYMRNIAVNGIEDTELVEIYSATGALVAVAKVSDGSARATLSSAGAYVVVAGGKASKVIVR